MAELKDLDLLSVQEARILLEQAARSGEALSNFTQEQVDRIIDEMARAVRKEAGNLAHLAVQETGRGKVSDKRIKNLFAAVDIYNYISHLKTCGIIAENKEKKVLDIAVPVGVVAAIIPTTNPTSTTIFKILAALKGRNTIVISPHPQAVKCTSKTARVMYQAALKAGAPEGCIGCLENVTSKGTTELMQNQVTDMILATGGPGLVRAAYSSGKPAFGVGPGNVPAFIERTANVKKSVRDILGGKTFDNGLLCSSEQAIVCDLPVEEAVLAALKDSHAYLLDDQDRIMLERVIQLPQGGLNTDIVGKSPQFIADLAGFSVPEDVVCLVGRARGVGPEYPLSMEKLSPILAFFAEDGWKASCERCIEILNFGGLGHTLAIHSEDEEIIMEFGLKKPAHRICVNTSSTHGSVGMTTGVPPSMTLGCGTPGGNITSDNITPLHLINIKRLARETRPIDEIVFDKVKDVGAVERSQLSEEKSVNPKSSGNLREVVRATIEEYVQERTVPIKKRPISSPVASSPLLREDGPAKGFVCEDDVRLAVSNGTRIVVNTRTIITPSARDAAEGQNIFIWK